MSHRLAILILFMLGHWFVVGQDKGQVSIFVDSLSFYPGDQIPMRMVVNIPTGAELLNNNVREALEANELELISIEKDEMVNGQNFDTYSFQTVFTAWEPKSHEIPSFDFQYTQNNQKAVTLKSKTYRLQVKAPNISGDSLFLVDIKPIIVEKKYISDYLLEIFTHPITIVLISIGLIVGFIGLILRMRKKAALLEQSPEEMAISMLESLRSSSLIQDGKYKAYHTQVSFITRQYINQRFGIRTLEVPTPIFVHDLSEHSLTDPELFDELSLVLKHADLIKFAKASPLELANQKAIDTPLAFIRSTQQRIIESEQTITNEKKEDDA